MERMNSTLQDTLDELAAAHQEEQAQAAHELEQVERVSREFPRAKSVFSLVPPLPPDWSTQKLAVNSVGLSVYACPGP